jgi:ribosomal protein S27AE
LSNKLLNKSTTCPNCGETLNLKENFCPNCGQKNTDLNISVWDIIKDFFGDYFSFDAKFFNTLVPLLFKPGKVPKDYIDGKRASHIPPLRIFIFLSFVTFFLWGLSFRTTTENELKAGEKSDSEKIMEILADTTDADFIVADSIVTGVNKELNNRSIDTLINGVNFSIDTVEANEVGLDFDEADLAYLLNKEIKATDIIDSLAPDFTGFKRHAFLQSLRVYQAKKGVVLKYLMGNISLVLLLLQPFFALLLKLFYIRRKEFFYIEHLVFSLYYHSFILLLTIFLFLANYLVGPDYLVLVLILSSFIYFIIALKRFYRQSTVKTIFKGILISGVYLIFLFPAFTVGYLLLSLYFY